MGRAIVDADGSTAEQTLPANIDACWLRQGTTNSPHSAAEMQHLIDKG
jgi:hypothetical protein